MKYFEDFINERGEVDQLIPIWMFSAMVIELNPSKADDILRNRLGVLYNPNITDAEKAKLLTNVLESEARVHYEKEQGNV